MYEYVAIQASVGINFNIELAKVFDFVIFKCIFLSMANISAVVGKFYKIIIIFFMI
jgi:hypothetical protein